MRHGRLLVGAAAMVALGWPLWAAAAWLRYGRGHRRRDPRLDELLPSYDVEDARAARIAAPPSVTCAVVMATGLDRSMLVRLIVGARERLLGARGGRPWPSGGVVEQLRGWGWGVLAEEPLRAVVLGAVTQPWRPDVQFRALAPDAFAAFDEPGFVKILVAIVVEPAGLQAASILRVVTRVATTDRAARARFRRYWATFSPGIVLIRRATLHAIRRDAERRWASALGRG